MNERTYPEVWQSYLWWNELVELRKRHRLRISAIDRGVSNLKKDFEEVWLDGVMEIDDKIDIAKEQLVTYASEIPCWKWVTSIKGLGAGNQAAKVLALIDDVEKFNTVSKLWRYAGYGLYEYWFDEHGKIKAPKNGYKSFRAKGKEFVDNTNTVCSKDHPRARKVKKDEIIRGFDTATPKEGWVLKWSIDKAVPGWNLSFSKPLKSATFVVVDMFIKQSPFPYRDYYDEQKAYYGSQHPQKVKIGDRWQYTDGHINYMTIRKVAKLWLQHLWVVWRTELSLPVTKPWVFEHGGHVDMIEPPHYDVSKIRYV